MSDYKKYGWFSQKQCDQYGFIQYRNVDGILVEVTMVNDTDQRSGCTCEFDDLVFVGQVKRWIASYGKGVLPNIHRT